jgi:sarcosine oxidase/L-pipecolate oxidase
MVATGGSGHSFKYLPILGSLVVDIIEGIETDRPVVRAWKWRKLGETSPVNVLMEGKKGSRALQNITLTSDTDLKLGTESKL